MRRLSSGQIVPHAEALTCIAVQSVGRGNARIADIPGPKENGDMVCFGSAMIVRLTSMFNQDFHLKGRSGNAVNAAMSITSPRTTSFNRNT